MKKPKNFEEAMLHIEELTAKLGSTQTELDEAVKDYAEITQLIAYCKQCLEKARVQVDEISAGDSEISETRQI